MTPINSPVDMILGAFKQRQSPISINRFFAAGHGTFFAGVIFPNDDKFGKKFTWIYDCGSKKKNHLIDIIENKSTSIISSKIDMLCLSHFDSDHVNGVEYLIKKYGVKNLVLPYMPLDQRLKVAFQKKSIDVLKFALDPIGYLRSKELLGSVDRVLLVDSNENPEDELSFEEFPPGENPNEDDYPILVNGAAFRKKLKQISGSSILQMAKNFEFAFFNMPPKFLTPKSGVAISTIQNEIRAIINSSEADVVHIQKLRQCYENHFGSSSKNRNGISLCVLFRPHDSLKNLGLLERIDCDPSPTGGLLNVRELTNKFGLLLTGDITINSATLNAMKSHFGKNRWDDIGVLQIPHHGSKHSWACVSQRITQHNHSVFCVPDRAGKHTSHPHNEVEESLENTNRFYADYSHRVEYTIAICPIAGMRNKIEELANIFKNSLVKTTQYRD